MSNYKEIVNKYYETLKQLQCEGIDNLEDARALAAQIACRGITSVSNQLMNLKSQPDAIPYHLTGTTIDILEVRIANPTRDLNEQLKIKFQKRVGHVLKTLQLKGDQAFRAITLILLKFERYEDDVRGGFDYGDISRRESELVDYLSHLGHKISAPLHESVRANDLMRNIKDNFQSKLELEGIVSNYRDRSGYRFEIAGHHFAFNKKAMDFLNDLSKDAIDAYQRRFEVKIRKVS